MVTPCSSQWRKRKEAGEEEEREEREREKEKLPTENHCFRSSSLSLSLSSSSREYLYLEYTPFTLPLSFYLVLFLLLRPLFPRYSSSYIYILDPEPSSRHSNESFRDFNPLLFHPRANTAHERTQIYTLQFRIPARISKARMYVRVGHVSEKQVTCFEISAHHYSIILRHFKIFN